MSALHREVMSELARDTHTEAFADGARYALQVAARLESERLAAEATMPPEPDRNSIVIDRENDVWRCVGGAWVETSSGASTSWDRLIAGYGPVKTYMETS